MDNMTNIISSHNKKVNSNYEANGKTCHCRNKSNCPLENKCLANKIVYKVETNNGINELCTKIYFGISGTEFKSRYNNHTMSFRNRTHENNTKISNTKLSKYIGSLKDQNTDFDNKWSIFKKSYGYSTVSKSCNLCLLEKLVICSFKQKYRILNKRLDLVSKCRHKNKYVLMNYSGID